MDNRTGSDPLIKVLIVLTVMMGAVILGVAYMIVRPSADEPPPRAPGRCDALGSTEESCSANEWCIRGRCQPRPDIEYAGRGESCRDRDCRPPHLFCNDNDRTCYKKGSLLPPPPHCEDPQVLAAVERLAAKCSQRQHDISAVAADPLSCSGDTWKNLVVNDNEIDLILSAFPDRFALVFPPGQPRRNGNFPKQSEQEFLLSQLRPYRSRLAQAHKIFVIGRESPDGGSNHELTLGRIDASEKALTILLKEGSTPSDEAPSPAYVSWGMEGEHVLTFPNFVKHYVGQNPPVAYREEQLERVRAGIARFRSGEFLPPAELAEIEKTINRVALIIPILCDPRKQPE